MSLLCHQRVAETETETEKRISNKEGLKPQVWVPRQNIVDRHFDVIPKCDLCIRKNTNLCYRALRIYGTIGSNETCGRFRLKGSHRLAYAISQNKLFAQLNIRAVFSYTCKQNKIIMLNKNNSQNKKVIILR